MKTHEFKMLSDGFPMILVHEAIGASTDMKMEIVHDVNVENGDHAESAPNIYVITVEEKRPAKGVYNPGVIAIFYSLTLRHIGTVRYSMDGREVTLTPNPAAA